MIFPLGKQKAVDNGFRVSLYKDFELLFLLPFELGGKDIVKRGVSTFSLGMLMKELILPQRGEKKGKGARW